jgi:hypothetical protein
MPRRSPRSRNAQRGHFRARCSVWGILRWNDAVEFTNLYQYVATNQHNAIKRHLRQMLIQLPVATSSAMLLLFIVISFIYLTPSLLSYAAAGRLGC